MFEIVTGDPAPELVRRITFVPFLPDGQCVLVESPDGPGLPVGQVLEGEDYLLDTVLRVPLQTAGFRYQHFRPFGLDGDHLYAWIEGAVYTGSRPHATAQLSTSSAEQAAGRLRAGGRIVQAAAVVAAAESYRTLDEQTFYADNVRTLQRGYLRARTAQQGSGFSGDEREWRQARHQVSEGIERSGTFLDVGCANGLLMESVTAWCAERGLQVEPYGLDIAPGLVELARGRLPQWADRIWAGNAIDWMPPQGQRFDYVHVLLDCVPQLRQADLIRHHLACTVAPGTGRLLVSQYSGDISAADTLGILGSVTPARAAAAIGPAAGRTRPRGSTRDRSPAAPRMVTAVPAAGAGLPGMATLHA
jgi:2-polyprenyl-3-methyl-5-hydroxy-6-metoxy-1,4-benzoquinol methylase